MRFAAFKYNEAVDGTYIIALVKQRKKRCLQKIICIFIASEK